MYCIQNIYIKCILLLLVFIIFIQGLWFTSSWVLFKHLNSNQKYFSLYLFFAQIALEIFLVNLLSKLLVIVY